MGKKFEISSETFVKVYFNCYKKWLPNLQLIFLQNSLFLSQEPIEVQHYPHYYAHLFNPHTVRNSLLFAYAMYQWLELPTSLEPMTITIIHNSQLPNNDLGRFDIRFNALGKKENLLLNTRTKDVQLYDFISDLVPFSLSDPHVSALEGFFFEILHTYYIHRQGQLLYAYFDETVSKKGKKKLSSEDIEYIGELLKKSEIPIDRLITNLMAKNLQQSIKTLTLN